LVLRNHDFNFDYRYLSTDIFELDFKPVLSIYCLFLPRDAMRKRGLCPVSVRLSVCLSVTFVHSIQTAEDIVKLLRPSGSPIILVFDPWRLYPIRRGTPSAGAQYTRGWKISTEIAVYLGNGTR